MMRSPIAVGLAAALSLLLLGRGASAADGVALKDLSGVIVDDADAERSGDWMASTHTKPFVAAGYSHDKDEGKGDKQATYTAKLPEAGRYQVLLAYTHGGNRASNVPVTVETADGPVELKVNQRTSPGATAPFELLGTYRFEKDQPARLVISNEGTDGHVILDAAAFVPAEAAEAFGKAVAAAVKKVDPKPEPAKEKAKEPPPPQAEPFERVPPAGDLEVLTVEKLDALVDAALGDAAPSGVVDDEPFLRRASLDAIGRPPTPSELRAFLADDAEGRRERAVERLLASEEYGRNWANYWSDTIGYRVQQPELTFLDYGSFEEWLAGQFNADTGWDETVYNMLTATGKVKENPAAAFVGFHRANPIALTNETTRVFLGLRINCAQCHNHPFDVWEQEQFHHMAAYFARVKANLPWNDSDLIEVSNTGKGEYKMEGGGVMSPVFLTGDERQLDASKVDRRQQLAELIVRPDNRWFAKSYVNRVWAELMGRGFYEPVDNLAEGEEQLLPEVHAALEESFVASGMRPKHVMRLVLNSQAYQRPLSTADEPPASPYAAAAVRRLRGDEVFDSLETAVGLPNKAGEQAPATDAVRFPPPPKSTRDLVNDALGFDPSLAPYQVSSTMKLAMFMMNNEQLDAQIDADPEADTLLGRLVAGEKDDAEAVRKLFTAVLARQPTEKELGICLEHIGSIESREAAFEDLAWSLINTAEFMNRR